MNPQQNSSAAYKVAGALGLGAILTAGAALAVWLIAIAVFVAPLAFWFAWNVLELGPAMGLPELGFWAILLATAFLVLGWFGKTIIAAVVFIVDPGWLDHQANVHWPEPTLRNFVAIVILAVLAAQSDSSDRKAARSRPTPRPG